MLLWCMCDASGCFGLRSCSAIIIYLQFELCDSIYSMFAWCIVLRHDTLYSTTISYCAI